MNLKRLGLSATFVLGVTMALPAEAAHRRCRTCSGGASQGGWYHFRSGHGMYVPFASQVVSAPSGTISHAPAQMVHHGPVHGAGWPVQPGPMPCRTCYQR